MTIQEFFTTYPLSSYDAEWALTNCTTMKEVWNKATPRLVIEIACSGIRRDGTMRPVLSDKEQMLFNAASIRFFEKEITDEASLEALRLLEMHAQGEASKEEFMDAWRKAPVDMWCLTFTKKSEASLAHQAAWLRSNTNPKL